MVTSIFSVYIKISLQTDHVYVTKQNSFFKKFSWMKWKLVKQLIVTEKLVHTAFNVFGHSKMSPQLMKKMFTHAC